MLSNGYVLAVLCFIAIAGFIYACRRIARRREEPEWMYWFWHGLAISNVLVLSYLLWKVTLIL